MHLYDLYAPALRPLRQVAKVHIFVQPTVSRVVNRLKYICNKEGVKTRAVALSALAGCTECDIRSCLNTLQFLNKKEVLNVMDISFQVVGRKDAAKSAFDTWKEMRMEVVGGTRIWQVLTTKRLGALQRCLGRRRLHHTWGNRMALTDDGLIPHFCPSNYCMNRSISV